MKWSDVADAIGKAAPILANVLTGNIPGAVVAAGSLIASAFGVANTPDAIHAAIASNPEAAIKLAQIEADNRTQLQTLAMQTAQHELEAETARLVEVNATMRTEAAAADPWTRRWRPFIGFVTGATFGVVCLMTLILLLVAIVQKNTEALTAIPTIITTMTALFAIPGSILGISAWHRGVMQVEAAKSGNASAGAIAG